MKIKAALAALVGPVARPRGGTFGGPAVPARGVRVWCVELRRARRGPRAPACYQDAGLSLP
ncbi:hypothetical protein PSP31121_05432 [Pandoraea sputorum]|uniref:Uncharacterized protein n=1 Tax=Pandoraea sputorum TaxID=93222 RepID=A0A5E5BHW1_9BURK|nr:hypothetical protein PSP31121_05432 [Pandoraea sputorum]